MMMMATTCGSGEVPLGNQMNLKCFTAATIQWCQYTFTQYILSEEIHLAKEFSIMCSCFEGKGTFTTLVPRTIGTSV